MCQIGDELGKGFLETGKAWLRGCLDQALLPDVLLRCSYARSPWDGHSLLLSQNVMPADQSRLSSVPGRDLLPLADFWATYQCS